MHTAPIWRLSMDAQERFLVTASKDKTARVWDLAGGELKLLKILRVPQGAHPYEGQIFSVAISPDGEKVAVAGYTGKKVPFGKEGNFNIHIFDRASGQLEHTISGLPIDISHLTFSRDGQYLAVSLMGHWGLRVYRSRDWQEVYKDPDYDFGEGNDCYWVEFGPGNLLVTTSWEGGLHLYKPSEKGFKRLGEPKDIIEDGKPMAARFSPDGNLLAIGFIDAPRVLVFEVKSLIEDKPLKPLYTVDTRGLTSGHLARVAWSKDNNLLYAGGGFSEGGIHPVLCWTEKGRGRLTRLPASFNSIMDIWPLQDGRVVFGAADPAFGILDPGGRRFPAQIPDIPDFHNKQQQLLLSTDGCLVEFMFGLQDKDLSQKNHQARLDIKTRKLTLDPPADTEGQELRPPDTTGFNYSKRTGELWFRDRRLWRSKEEKSHCFARIPGGRFLILGTNWHLRFFDENGAPRGRPIELPSSAWGVNVSGDGQVAVVALGDGTLRWYRLRDRKEILAFFRHRDGNWVMWSPEGFFTCSTDGGKLIGYHLNKGLEETPQFVTAEQFFDQFYRRDLVTWRLEAFPTNETKKEVQAALQQGDVKQVLSKGLPPPVEIIGPPEVRHKGEVYTLRLKVTARDGKIPKIIYQVNGATIDPGKTRFDKPDFGPGGTTTMECVNQVPVKPGEKNEVVAMTVNERGIVSDKATQIVHSGDPKPKDRTLYGLVVGISAYSHIEPKLDNAAKDALDIRNEINKRSLGLFKEVKIKKLTDQEVTLKGIREAFEELKTQVKPEDAFFLFLAGHGKNLKGRYYFFPQDLRASDDEALIAGGLGQEKLRELVPKIPAQQKLIILDTCYSKATLSPEALKTAMDRLVHQLGSSALLAAAKTEAKDDYQGNGLFTYALLEALKRPDTDRDGDGKIDVKELFQAAEALVSKICREKGIIQEPMSSDLRYVKYVIAKRADKLN
ncbi:MAG: caspase family protein [Thermodesulfobacteriota bacterium]